MITKHIFIHHLTGFYLKRYTFVIHAFTLRPLVAINVTRPLPPKPNVNKSWRATYKLCPMISLLDRLILIFSQKSQSKELIYFKEGYVHNIYEAKNAEGTKIIAARCYRSMRKGESQHRMNIDLKDYVVADAYCSCTAR